MIVQAIWEFDVDTADFDPKHIDVKGLALDLTKRELECVLSKNEITADDFIYKIKEK